MTTPPDDLQFDTVEPTTPATTTATTCVGCGRPITSTYFAIGNKIVCPNCREQILVPLPGSATFRVAKATVLGLGAGLIGAVVWWGVRKVTGYEIGLIAIALGFLVAKAVRSVTLGRGGRGYQVLAVLITYASVAANYAPDMYKMAVEAIAHDSAGPVHLSLIMKARLVVVSYLIGLIAPFFALTTNPIQLLIIGFALWEAWKLTGSRKLPFTGPHVLPARTPASVAALPELQGDGDVV